MRTIRIATLCAALVATAAGNGIDCRRSPCAGPTRLDCGEQSSRAGPTRRPRALRARERGPVRRHWPRRGGLEPEHREPRQGSRRHRGGAGNAAGRAQDGAGSARPPGPRHPHQVGADQSPRRPTLSGADAALHRRDGVGLRRPPVAARRAGRSRAPAGGSRQTSQVRGAGRWL